MKITKKTMLNYIFMDIDNLGGSYIRMLRNPYSKIENVYNDFIKGELTVGDCYFRLFI